MVQCREDNDSYVGVFVGVGGDQDTVGDNLGWDDVIKGGRDEVAVQLDKRAHTVRERWKTDSNRGLTATVFGSCGIYMWTMYSCQFSINTTSCLATT